VKIKLDENIPVSLVEVLTLLGHDAPHGYWARFDRQNGPGDMDALST
jgi:hypothetical protein